MSDQLVVMSDQLRADASQLARGTEVPRRTVRPVKWFAALGCAFLALYAYSITRWFLGGYAHSTPVGRDELPGWMFFSLRFHEVLFTGMVFVAVYFAIYRPWRREKRLTLDGLVLIAMGTMWGQDPIFNYGQVWLTYNSGLVNLGCPQCFLPGWLSPAQTFSESLGWTLAFYCGFIWIGARIGMRFMRWAEARWPQLGKVGAVGLLYLAFLAFDLLSELIWLRVGVYTYAGATGPLVLFQGHYYQVPLHEVALAAAWYTSIVAVWYFKDDKGHTLAERGVEYVKGTSRQRTGLRLLALIGLFNAGILVSYNLPMTWVAATFNKWPSDIVNRSYFTQGICGPETTYACPDNRLPITQEGGTRIMPDGKLFTPGGLPMQSGR